MGNGKTGNGEVERHPTLRSTHTLKYVGDEVRLDVGSSVVAGHGGYEQRRDAAERQEQSEAEAAEQREVERHFYLH